MRVALDARIVPGETGGVESIIAGLASGLGTLADGDDDYLFLTYEGCDDWLRPLITGPTRLMHVPRPIEQVSLRDRAALAAPRIAAAWHRRPWRSSRVSIPPPSDGTIERARVDVMHFTWQTGFATEVPSIYHPHDLQHRHLPEFFSEEQFQWRESWYRFLCAQATIVAVASQWTKRDVVGQFGLDPAKVKVIPFAPPIAAYEAPNLDESAEIRASLGVPPAYAFYPAQTWPHKNHSALLRAVAYLRDEMSIRVPLVFSGRQSEHFGVIAAEQAALNLDDQVTWLGFVSPAQLRALYGGARAVIVPTRFEAASAPLWEAYLAGVPTACSNVTSLPDQAGGASLIFDPDDVRAIADAVRRLWFEEALRKSLIRRGHERIEALSWERTARTFRALYRSVAGQPLADSDQHLLEAESPI